MSARYLALRAALDRCDEAISGLGTVIVLGPSGVDGVAGMPREYLGLVPDRIVPVPFLVTEIPATMPTAILRTPVTAAFRRIEPQEWFR